MPDALLAPADAREVRDIDLATMSLADAPDLWTAIEAGIMHGLKPGEAIKSAFGKWATENADAVQTFGLANFYDGKHAGRMFVNYSRLAQYLAICAHEAQRTATAQARIIAQQGAQLAALTDEVRAIRRLLPYLPPSED